VAERRRGLWWQWPGTEHVSGNSGEFQCVPVRISVWRRSLHNSSINHDNLIPSSLFILLFDNMTNVMQPLQIRGRGICFKGGRSVTVPFLRSEFRGCFLDEITTRLAIFRHDITNLRLVLLILLAPSHDATLLLRPIFIFLTMIIN
jgi:hypothetical protein